LSTRTLYLIIKDREDLRTKYDPIMLPRMCLNRYYAAEGVRVYSIDTWRTILEDKGRETVCKYSREVCEYYIE
jgi:hypothetical protein